MTTSEALVATGRADRYLEQFASHFAHQPGGIQAQLDGDGRLVIDFGGATCSMEATIDGLVLHAEAAGTEELGQLQRRLADRIEQIGRRDGIAVQWSPDFTSAAPQDSSGHRRH
jgi:hypothetical protein